MSTGATSNLRHGNGTLNTVVVEELVHPTGGFAQGPERSLMSALLFDGVMGYMCYTASNGRSARYHEAFKWVNTQDSEYVFSFENVCEGLGIDPSALRLGLINAANSKRGEWTRKRRKDA